jgi:hypothetical protein
VVLQSNSSSVNSRARLIAAGDASGGSGSSVCVFHWPQFLGSLPLPLQFGDQRDNAGGAARHQPTGSLAL